MINVLTEDGTGDADSVTLATVAHLGTRATASLLTAFSESEGFARMRVAQALEATGDTAAVVPLINALDDKGHLTVGAIAQALGTIGDPRALEPLLEMYSRNPVPSISKQVAVALGRLGGQRALAALFQELDKPVVGQDAAEGLAEFGESVRDRLEDVVTSSPKPYDFAHQWRRDHACIALGIIGSPASTQVLVDVVNHTNMTKGFPVAAPAKAAAALGRIADPRAIPALVEALGRSGVEFGWLQYAAARALGQFNRSQVIAPLLEALEKGSMQQRSMSAYALGEAPDSSAVEPLINALHENEPVLKQNAARALEIIGGRRAIEALEVGLVKGDLHVVAGAARYFVRRGGARNEEMLLAAIEAHGSNALGRTLFFSGNRKLAHAAEQWAKKQHQVVWVLEVASIGV